MNYSALHEFVIIATPAPSLGEMKVSMLARIKDAENGPSYYAAPRIWRDDYSFHLHHSAGLAFEDADEITERLKTGQPATFTVTCLVQNLADVGFVGVQQG